MNSIEKVAVPLLLVQTASVVLLWSLDTLSHVSQTIFTLFLAADLLSFGLMAHVYMSTKTGTEVTTTTMVGWGLAIMILFVAGFIVS